MLTELQSPELYMYNLKNNKIWFISISRLRLDSKKPKMALCGVTFGIINLYLQDEQICFQKF